MKKIYIYLTLLITVIFSFSSCASMDHNIKVLPVDNSLPASASSALFIDGKAIDSSGYDVIEEFSLPMSTKEPISAENLIPIDFNPELQEIVDRTGANAVTDLKFQLVNIDKSAISWISMERYIGILGAGTAAYGIAYQAMSDQNGLPILLGGAGVAAAGFGGSLLHSMLGTITYNYELSGKAVKLK